MTQSTNPLGSEKIVSLLIRFSVPAIIGMSVNAFYNIIDRIFIGNAPDLGSYGLAGITIGFPIMLLQLSIGLLFGVGGATLFSIKLGEGKPEQAQSVLGNAFTMLLISGSLFVILGQLFLEPILQLFGASDVVLPYAMDYMRIIFWGSIFSVLSIGLNNFLRADGQPKLAMVSMLIGAVLNILLDPLFIFVFKMGMAGAAMATVLSQLISLFWILAYFLSKRGHHRLRLKQMLPDKQNVLAITALGLPSFFTQISQSLLNIVINRSLLTYGGDIAVSGMGIINSVQAIILMPIIGIVQGSQPIISYNFGGRNFARIKETEKLAIIAATVIGLGGWVLTRVFPEQIIALFNHEPELVSFGRHALQVWFWGLPVVGFQILGATFFQAIGRSRSAMFLTLTRQVVLLIPAILIFARIGGLEGILYAAPFADITAALITAIWFYNGMRELARELA